MKKLLTPILILIVLSVFSGCSLFDTVEPERIEPDPVAQDEGDPEDLADLQDRIADLREQGDDDTAAEDEVDEAAEEDSDAAVEENDAAPEMTPEQIDTQEQIDALQAKIDELEEQIETQKQELVKTYTGENFIVLTSPEDEFTTHEEPVIFTGAVSPNTTKIVVKASHGNKDCDYAMCDPYKEDVYTLTAFEPGDSSFTYRAKVEYNNLWFGSNDYKFAAYFDDGTTKSTSIVVFYSTPGAEMGKPVIYLYPEKKQNVFVNVEPTDGISISIPKLGKGWNVVATPKGEIYNRGDFKTYPYLFWEGFAADFVTPEEGFVVAKNDVPKFFDKTLTYMGLNKKEIADFKEFWVPRLSEKPYYFITYIPQEEFDKYAPLTVTPAPDTLIRVFFDYKGLDKKISVEAQKLEKGVRKGFTVIEWGGRLYR